MVSSSERRRLEAWYLDPPQPVEGLEKSCAGFIFVVCFALPGLCSALAELPLADASAAQLRAASRP
jgi:hypothetical protein